MSEVVSMRWPEGLRERVDARAGAGKRSAFVVLAVERALRDGVAVAPPRRRRAKKGEK